MIEIVPPIDPAEELRKQWKDNVMAKIKKMRRSNDGEFKKELEKYVEKQKEEGRTYLNEHSNIRFNAI